MQTNDKLAAESQYFKFYFKFRQLNRFPLVSTSLQRIESANRQKDKGLISASQFPGQENMRKHLHTTDTLFNVFLVSLRQKKF